MAHSNIGNCAGCLQIFNKYPNFYKPLQDWFFEIQSKNPTFHISCAGRGKIDQEACFSRGASKAHWLQSAHNFNVAIDTFFLIDGAYCLDVNLYDVIVVGLNPEIEWYGATGAEFPERPHFEFRGWKQLVSDEILKPVE